jgi:outer membrane protein OmpA-like peptidoglycan-associated protein
MELRRVRLAVIVLIAIAGGLVSSSNAAADDHIKGVITARAADGSVTMRTNDAAAVLLVMNDETKVRRVDGIRQIKESGASLIPGLRVEVSGAWDGTNRFVVQRIEFTRSDMKMALAIKGGVTPTDVRSIDNQRRLDENDRILAEQRARLQQQAAEIAANRTAISANEAKIVATSGRISNLDNYNTLSSVTIYFRNGKAVIDPKFKSQLQALAAQAKGTQGYLIQVQGYASAVGPNALNQKLSQARAENVTHALQQEGVPLTSIVVPAAMGVTDQVATNKTASGQAENRRTVVTLLQSKGIAGQ